CRFKSCFPHFLQPFLARACDTFRKPFFFAPRPLLFVIRQKTGELVEPFCFYKSKAQRASARRLSRTASFPLGTISESYGHNEVNESRHWLLRLLPNGQGNFLDSNALGLG
ncbi:MAG: hypothetical protein JW719_02970, partial [Pirellulales bacterium]|nr:hypothetical protein [Pirellulales bacterium]